MMPVTTCVYGERGAGDEEEDNSYAQAKHSLSSNACGTLTKHIVCLWDSHMMDLTSAETCSPEDSSLYV